MSTKKFKMQIKQSWQRIFCAFVIFELRQSCYILWSFAKKKSQWEVAHNLLSEILPLFKFSKTPLHFDASHHIVFFFTHTFLKCCHWCALLKKMNRGSMCLFDVFGGLWCFCGGWRLCKCMYQILDDIFVPWYGAVDTFCLDSLITNSLWFSGRKKRHHAVRGLLLSVMKNHYLFSHSRMISPILWKKHTPRRPGWKLTLKWSQRKKGPGISPCFSVREHQLNTCHRGCPELTALLLGQKSTCT